jgi:hypothetical protein
VELETVYPGWYRGRAIHVHVRVRTGGTIAGETYGGGHIAHTGQLYFPEHESDEIVTLPPYVAHAGRRMLQWEDFIFANGQNETLASGVPQPRAKTRSPVGAWERYRSLATYEDTVTISRNSQPNDGSRPDQIHWTFRTAFDRGSGGFYFHVTKSAEGAIPVAYELSRAAYGPLALWSSVDGKVELMAPDTGLYALKGVSASTSYDIPSRLFGAPVADPPYVVDGEEVIRGARCFRLVAHEPDRTEMVWIGAADHNIHRRFERAWIDPNVVIAKLAARSLLTEDIRTRLLAEKPAVHETTVEYAPSNDGTMERARFTGGHALGL